MPRLTECGTGFCNPSLPCSQLEVGLLNRCVGISAEKGERIWMNTKGKHTPLKDVLREWVKKDSASQTIPNQSIGHCLLIFFYLAQGTKYLREALQQKASYPSVYQACLQSKMKSSLISGILRSFYL